MVQPNRDHLREWVAARLEKKDPEGRQVIAFGIVTEASSLGHFSMCHVLRHQAKSCSRPNEL